MANNVTVVDNGVVQQRFYQVYGDLIESKETMEPIAIAHGNGPICGFDIVDTSTDHVVIRGSWDPSLSSAGISASTILKKVNRRIILSDGENNGGTVVNATITNDGLIHICPTILDFTNVKPTNGWFDLSQPNQFVAFAMKVSHSYTPVSDASNLGVSDFDITWLSLGKTTGGTYSPAEVASMDYSSLIRYILPAGWINRDTDALVGIYIVGYDPSWGDNDMYASFGYKVALVSYDGKWPVSPFISGSLDILSLNDKVKNIPKIETDVDNLKGLNSILQNQVNTLGKGIECDYTLSTNVTDEGTGDGTVSITIKKLVYLGVSLYEGAGKTFTSNTLYLSNIRAIYLDILSPGTNQDTGLPSISKWGLSLGSSAVRLTNPRDIKGSLSGDFQGTGVSGSTTAGIICLINKDGSQTPDSLYDQVGNGKSSKVVKPSDDPSYYLALVLNNFFNRFANTGDKLDTSSERDKRYTRIFIDTKSGGLTSSDTCGITFRLYPTGINLSWYVYLSNTSSPSYTQGTFRLDLNSELALHFNSYVLKNVYDFYKKVTAQESGGKLLLQSMPLMVNTTQIGLESEVNGHIFVYLRDDSSGNFYLEVVVGTISGSSSTIRNTYFGTTFIPFMLNDVWDLCNTGDVSITPHV